MTIISKFVLDVTLSFTNFVQMENIGHFLEACDKYGIPKTDIFQTVDLYEAQNIPQVSKPQECRSVDTPFLIAIS